MRFVCQHCDAKYTIADDKVRGKVLRVRCKQCGTIIEVRDPGAPRAPVASAAPPAASSAKPPASPRDGAVQKAPPPPGKSVLEGKFASAFKPTGAGKPVAGTPGLYDTVKKSAQAIGKRDVDLSHWFAAVDRTPVGPVSARRVHQYQKAGKINDDSLVWKEGMADWVALRNCKELVGLVARIDLEDSGALDPGGELVPRLGLFAGQSQGASPLKGYSMGVIGERDSLEPTDDDSKTQANYRLDQLFPSPPSSGKAGASSDPLAESSAARSFFGPEGDPDMSLHPVSAGELHSLAPPRAVGQNRVVTIAAIGLFLVALVLLVTMLLAPGEPGERIVTQTVEKVVEKVVYRDRPLSPGVRVDEDDNDSKNSAKRNDKNRPAASAKAGAAKSSGVDAKTKALMEQMGMASGSGGPIGGDRLRRPNEGNGSSSGGGSALTAPQIKSVVDSNRSGLQSCYVRSLKQGDAPADQDIRINFKLTVGTSGMVKNVGLSGEGSGNANLSSCLTKTIKKWVFPAASSESPVEFPILFSPR